MATLQTPNQPTFSSSSALRKSMIAGVGLCALLLVIGLLIFPNALRLGGITPLLGDSLIFSLYALAGFVGPLAVERVKPQALRQGILFGIIVGIWFSADILIGILVPLDSSGNAALGLIEFGGLLVFFLIAGMRGALKTETIGGGVAAAMWTSIIGTLIWFIMLLLTYYLFLGTLQEARSLQSDQVMADFTRSGMTDLRAFIMQDYMGAGFFHMLLSPAVAAVIGGFAGLLIKVRSRLRSAQQPISTPR
jgi:hypothetical protein